MTTEAANHQLKILLEAAEVAGDALHQFHPPKERTPVGKGICEWGPCKRLRDAIAQAKAPK